MFYSNRYPTSLSDLCASLAYNSYLAEILFSVETLLKSKVVKDVIRKALPISWFNAEGCF